VPSGTWAWERAERANDADVPAVKDAVALKIVFTATTSGTTKVSPETGKSTVTEAEHVRLDTELSADVWTEYTPATE